MTTPKRKPVASAVLALLVAIAVLALAGVSAAGDGRGNGHGKGNDNGKGNGNGNGNAQSSSSAQNQYGSGGKQYGHHRVTLCHKGHTISVAQPAVKAHMRHGDTLGACK